MRRKVGCPQAGCGYIVTAEKAEDAMDDLREHLRTAHGIDEVPNEAGGAVAGKIKSSAKVRR